MQSKSHSFMESVANVLVGYGLAVSVQVIVFPWFGMYPTINDNLVIGAIFTAVSLARSYVIRRAFNAIQ